MRVLGDGATQRARGIPAAATIEEQTGRNGQIPTDSFLAG